MFADEMGWMESFLENGCELSLSHVTVHRTEEQATWLSYSGSHGLHHCRTHTLRSAERHASIGGKVVGSIIYSKCDLPASEELLDL